MESKKLLIGDKEWYWVTVIAQEEIERFREAHTLEEYTLAPEENPFPNLNVKVYRIDQQDWLHWYAEGDSYWYQDSDYSAIWQYYQRMKEAAEMTDLPEPDNQNFIGQVDALVNELSTLLEVAPAQLDKTPESFHLLDQKIREFLPTGEFNSVLVNPVIAYYGEALRQAYPLLEWKLYLSCNPKIYRPYLSDQAENLQIHFCKSITDVMGFHLDYEIADWPALYPSFKRRLHEVEEFYHSKNSQITQPTVYPCYNIRFYLIHRPSWQAYKTEKASTSTRKERWMKLAQFLEKELNELNLEQLAEQSENYPFAQNSFLSPAYYDRVFVRNQQHLSKYMNQELQRLKVMVLEVKNHFQQMSMYLTNTDIVALEQLYFFYLNQTPDRPFWFFQPSYEFSEKFLSWLGNQLPAWRGVLMQTSSHLSKLILDDTRENKSLKITCLGGYPAVYYAISESLLEDTQVFLVQEAKPDENLRQEYSNFLALLHRGLSEEMSLAIWSGL